jgi:carboxyl-terminal processing protease
VFKSLPYEELEIKSDATLKEKREAWHQALSKDVYVEEALNVLDDLQSKNNVVKGGPSKMKKEKLVKS